MTQKMHSSVTLTVSSQEEVDYLLCHIGGLFMFGKYAMLTHFQDMKQVHQCTKCWGFDHYTSQCNRRGTCCICAGPHTEDTHTCTNCPPTAKTQKGCQHHPMKCMNCKGNHPANSMPPLHHSQRQHTECNSG
ncbi:hypothetical protein J3A83DRAFT_4099848 [Scleroderma citrinum]